MVKQNDTPGKTGLGLRSAYYGELLAGRKVSWLEIVSENFMVEGGYSLQVLDRLAPDYPLAMHGVSLSIGSHHPFPKTYLKKLKKLAQRVKPFIISDHLCWTGEQGLNLHDLYPVAFTHDNLDHIVSRVNQVQDFLGNQLVLENVSSYIELAPPDMAEETFLNELAKRSGCGLLLDVNNVYVNSINHGFSAQKFLQGIHPSHVKQFHLAGHSVTHRKDGRKLLIDTHDAPVCPEVFALYKEAVWRFGDLPVMVERDDKFPELDVLLAELKTVQDIIDCRVASIVTSSEGVQEEGK